MELPWREKVSRYF